MNLEIKYLLDRENIALEQLDWAIRLFLDYNAYIPAITLAAASEELIGKTLDEESSQSKLKNKLIELYPDKEKKDISDNHLNKVKNLLKHWDGSKSEVEIEPIYEAIQVISRAINNLLVSNRSLSSESPRFIEWLNSSEVANQLNNIPYPSTLP